MSYTSANDAWVSLIYGHAGVSAGMTLYRTTNAGASWAKAATLSEVGPAIFSSSTFGVAVSAQQNNSVMMTADGGQSWHKMALPIPNRYKAVDARLQQAVFGDPTHVFVPASFVNPDTNARAELFVDEITEGGTAWSQVRLPTGTYAFSAVSPSEWVTVGADSSGASFVGHSSNGGQSWTTTKPNIDIRGIRDVQFATGNIGIGIWMGGACAPSASGAPGCPPTSSLLRTTNGGATWREVKIP